MRKIYKMASLTCLGLLFTAQSSQAQTQVIIANGGTFETMPPYADRATVGSYNMTSKTYTVFDTIHTESVNGITIADKYAYVGAYDTLVKYDIDNHTRIATAYADQIKNVYHAGNELFVSFFNGAGAPLMKSFDETTLAVNFSFNDLEENVGGVVVMNDSIYIASNVPGTIDLWPPYGIYADTLGVISVFNANTGAFVRKIQLGVDGAGVNQLVAHNNTINAVCLETGNVLEYNTTTGVQTFTNIDIYATLVDSYDDYLVVETTNGIDKYDMNTKTMSNQGFANTHVAAAYDYLNDEYYFTQSDYFSYGKTLIHNATGMAVDSFDVAIAPEFIAIDFRFPVSVNELQENSPLFVVYPNPVKENCSIELSVEANEIQLIDFTGRTVISKSNVPKGVHQMDLNQLVPGVYFVRVFTKNGTTVEKLIKQ